jgi:DNA-directed RNA polymerase specialized sigma24 family protein
MTHLSTCSDLDKLRQLAMGELPDLELELLEQHVLACVDCAEELNALQTRDSFTQEVQAASALTPARDVAAEELIERLVRTPPALAQPRFRDSRETRAAAMRQSLVANARLENDEAILALDKALIELQAVDEDSVRMVQLRYFAGLTLAEAAGILGMSPDAADRLWAYAKAWLHRKTQGGSHPL